MSLPSRGALLWSFLHVLNKERYEALVQVYGSLDAAAADIGEEMLRGLKCRDEVVMKSLLRLEEDWHPDAYAAELERRGIRFLELNDAAYPQRLKTIPDPPPFLYALGDLSILDQPCVGLVGTREMSQYGRRVVAAFVPEFVAAGMVTVSGLARGIDGAVARETLRAGGRTVAALGHGLGMIYPPNHAELAKEIVAAGGLLLSEFPLDYGTQKYTFPARNRVIAGVSLATVVLEAPEGSGAIITADLALDYGRDVFAVPGDIFQPTMAGSLALLAGGKAGVARCAADVLQAMGKPPAPAKAAAVYQPQDPAEAAVYAALHSQPQTVDALTRVVSLSTAEISAALTMLELAGAVQNVGGGSWTRS